MTRTLTDAQIQQLDDALTNAVDAQSNPARRNFPTIHDFGQLRRALTTLRASAIAQEPSNPSDNEIRAAWNRTQDPVKMVRELAARLPSGEAPVLRKAAQAVLERWNSPRWEWAQHGPTGELMADLKRALDGVKEVDLE